MMEEQQTVETTDETLQVEDGATVPQEVDDGPGVPDQYEAFDLPEGVTLEGDRLEQATAIARERGWTQDQAQENVSLFTQLQQEEYQRQATAATEQAEAWRQEVMADSEMGGGNLQRTVDSANKALAQEPGLSDLLVERGLGNHPLLIRHFANLGKRMGEDPNASGGAPVDTRPKSREEILYPEG